MKNSVKKFLAVALVGTAAFASSVTGAEARDRDGYRDYDGRYERHYARDDRYDRYDRHDRGYHRGWNKKKVVHKHYHHSRPKYVYRDHYPRYHRDGRLIIGFNL